MAMWISSGTSIRIKGAEAQSMVRIRQGRTRGMLPRGGEKLAERITEKKEETIKGILAEYTRFLLGLASFSLLVFLGFYLFSNSQYQKNIEYVLLLNRFYQELDQCEGDLVQYVRNGTETYFVSVEQSSSQLTDTMKQLQGIRISREFSRDMQDLGFQLQLYQEMITIIHVQFTGNQGNLFNSEILSGVADNAAEAAHMYDLMTLQFKDIYFDLILAVNDNQQRLNAHLTGYCMLLISMIFLFMLLATVYANAMSNRIIRPLQELVVSAEKIRDGQIDTFESVVIEWPAYREISRLVSVFNRMVLQLRDHIHTIHENARTEMVLHEKELENARTEMALHEKELENMRITNLLKTSELKALQMQMNPHFLFNTLNMIARTADMGDTAQTSALLQRTAQLLRYNLDYSGRTVSLATEIEMLGNYAYLQEQRFRSRVFFDFDLDERFHRTPVPCFILQPLVENSIIHGMNDSVMQHFVVTVKTRYAPKLRQGEISIIDNGAGMEEETKRKVMESLDIDRCQREKIGLANVHMRLQMVFGNRYQMKLESRYGAGTEITIILQDV